MLSLVLGGCVLLLLWLWMKRDNRLSAIPGPKGLPFIGVAGLIKPVNKIHLILNEWTRKYGPIVHAPLPTAPTVIISGYDAIYDITVKRGKTFGGRPNTVRVSVPFKETGILGSTLPDKTWNSLRKTSQKHLKQFGDGLTHLESVITEVGDEMFKDFEQHANKPYDPSTVLFDTSLKSISFLMTGERRAGDNLTKRMKEHEQIVLKYFGPVVPFKYMIIDILPWLKYFGITIWQKIKYFLALEDVIWSEIKGINEINPDSPSLCKTLMSACDGINFQEKDAQKTTLSVLLAGVATTSNTMYGCFNILAYHPEIQEAILDEIHRNCPGGTATLPDRPNMPYTRAFLFELLRYTSVVGLSVPHMSLEDASIGEYQIPKGTTLLVNLWGLHHDPDFWVEPDKFIPDRFLDASGELHPADHPVRKHLMPFGAGTRVCLGESLALARLFLWITKTVSLFQLTPAEGNDPATVETDSFLFNLIVTPAPYKVVFKPRNCSN